ncbi:hypothetical protein ZWY2020_044437 [Hordeum vulgare]|nr:hypothetical protein ZWY2020_044437 [Hordeum vulgare]
MSHPVDPSKRLPTSRCRPGYKWARPCTSTTTTQARAHTHREIVSRAIAVADHQSSSARPRFTVGYALQPGKAGSVIQPSSWPSRPSAACGSSPSTLAPLADQGPFHLIVHKLYDRAWRARLEAFSALHPSVPVVDAPAAIDRLLDRFTMLDPAGRACGRLADPDAAASVPFANISNLPADAAGLVDKEEEGEGSTPPAGFVDQVARGLRRALGLHLLNFDMLAATELDEGGRRSYFLVDINYFLGSPRCRATRLLSRISSPR